MRKLQGRRLSYAIILVIAITGYMGRMVMFNDLSHNLNLRLVLFSTLVFVVLWEIFVFLNRKLAAYYPLHEKPIRRVVYQLLLSYIFLSGIRSIGVYYLAAYFPVEFNWAFRAAIYVVDFFFVGCVNAVFFIREYIQKWQESIHKAERLEKEKTQVQFDNLKNQLNPHFLFNALSSLNSLIKNNPELASEFLQHMSKVYRYVLQHKEKSVVSLREELAFIRDYVFLLDTRFGKAFSFTIDVSEEDKDKSIVPVTLQILIENAIKHNTISDKRPLRLSLLVEDNFLVMCNPVQKKKIVEGSNGQGLENLKNLYLYLSDEKVEWSENEEEFRIRIPLVER